jgi:hypothetical protein
MKTKIKVIEQKINAVYSTHKFIENAKKIKIEFYGSNIERLEALPIEKIESYNFAPEVLRLSFELEKLTYIEKNLWDHIKIERHVYAPELNKIFIKGYDIKAPQVDNMEKAIKFLCDLFSIDDLRNLKKFPTQIGA